LLFSHHIRHRGRSQVHTGETASLFSDILTNAKSTAECSAVAPFSLRLRLLAKNANLPKSRDGKAGANPEKKVQSDGWRRELV
jgi:hypothetical protein